MRRQQKNKKTASLPVPQQAAAVHVPEGGGVSIAYGGRRIIPTPGELLFDRVLSDGEKICWMALRALCENITRLPDQQVLAETLGKNRSSISSHLKMLRATRWLIFSETVRQNNLPTRQTYIIYDNPLPLLEAVNLDQYYLDFITSEADQDKPSRLRDYCRNFVLSIDGDSLLELETFGFRNKLKQASWYPLTTIGEISDAEKSNNGECSDAENSNNGENPYAEKSDNGENPDAEKSDNGRSSDAEKSDNGESPDTEKSNNGECSDAENSNNGEIPDAENSNNGEKSGDIYNRARTYARTEPRAGAPTQIGIKSSGRRFNNPSNQPDGWGCGGREDDVGDADGSPFAFLDTPPLSCLIPHLQARYGNKTAHALLNRLKAGHYTFRDETFRYRVDAEEAAVVLMSLLDRDVHAPLNFVDGLIRRATQGNLTFQGGQYRRFQELTADPDRDEKPATPAVPELPDGTRFIGRSGTRYRIENRCLINEATGTNGGPGEDGVHPFRVQAVEEIAGLVQAGCLRIVAGGEK